MCIDFYGHHFGGNSSFVYVNDLCYYRNCIRSTGTNLALRKKKTGKESQYMVSHPELGSDPPIGSDQESGRDTYLARWATLLHFLK